MILKKTYSSIRQNFVNSLLRCYSKSVILLSLLLLTSSIYSLSFLVVIYCYDPVLIFGIRNRYLLFSISGFIFLKLRLASKRQLLPPEIIVKLFQLVRLSFVIFETRRTTEWNRFEICCTFLKRNTILNFQTVRFLIF